MTPLNFRCAVCGEVHLTFDGDDMVTTGDLAIRILCADCSKTHFLVVEPIDPGPGADQE
jgi:ribosomal protein L44E